MLLNKSHQQEGCAESVWSDMRSARTWEGVTQSPRTSWEESKKESGPQSKQRFSQSGSALQTRRVGNWLGSREHVRSSIAIKCLPFKCLSSSPEVEVLVPKIAWGNAREDPGCQKTTTQTAEREAGVGFPGQDPFCRLDWTRCGLAVFGRILLMNRMPMF